MSMKRLSRDEAFLIALNIAKPPSGSAGLGFYQVGSLRPALGYFMPFKAADPRILVLAPFQLDGVELLRCVNDNSPHEIPSASADALPALRGKIQRCSRGGGARSEGPRSDLS
jgi:hypothetical protein